jgi:tetratricopeptide (TPR) repeat protein
MLRKIAISVFLLFVVSRLCMACEWDFDTLLMERREFPGVIEIISGKFLRHTPEFYEWRIRDRTAKLEQDGQRVEWYDDIAVAYRKLGNHAKAIEVIRQKDQIKPGLYETEANLGTFLLFDGQWEEALKHVRRALEINPDAHFGREKYQALLIEYVIPRLKHGVPQLPLSEVVVSITPVDGLGKLVAFDQKERFNQFLERTQGNEFQREEAVHAVLGMMRFADHRSPILLEVLATLLSSPHYNRELHLATRACLRAAEASSDESVRDAYRKLASDIIFTQVGSSIESVESQLKREIHEADEWYAGFRANELAWIRNGKDPEAEFARQYPGEPQMTVAWTAQLAEWLGIDTLPKRIAWVLGALVLSIVGLIAWLIRRGRARRLVRQN